jgi:hypothetical protein
VLLQYSTVWRIHKNESIDVGAVTCKDVAREYPTRMGKQGSETKLRIDAPGVVTVRRCNEGGFGFSIYPENRGSLDSTNPLQQLDDADDRNCNLVVGRFLQGLKGGGSAHQQSGLSQLLFQLYESHWRTEKQQRAGPILSLRWSHVPQRKQAARQAHHRRCRDCPIVILRYLFAGCTVQQTCRKSTDAYKSTNANEFIRKDRPSQFLS